MTVLTSLIPAESGWRAVYANRDGSTDLTRVIAWALTDGSEVVGLVLHPDDPTRIVPASEAAGEGASLERYGFKES